MKLGSRVIDGAVWNVGLALSNKVVTLFGQMALAWFLLPSDMGLANLAQATVAFTAVLSVGGLGDVLLQRQSFEEEAGQALWLSMGFSFVMGLAIVVLAVFSPVLFRPGLEGLMLVLSLNVVLGAPATVLAAGLKNKLDFKGLALCLMWTGCVSTLLSVLLAWLGWGPYALIVPSLVQQCLSMGAMLRRGGGFKVRRPDWTVLKTLAKPTLALSLTGLFVGLQSQVPVFICGHFLNATSLGHFSWGWAVAGQAVFLLAVNLREVLLPAFTKMDADAALRAARALKAARAITATLCVVCGTQALLARPLLILLVPSKWMPAVPVVICASLGLVAQGLWIVGMAWLNACGKYRLLLKISVFQVLCFAVFTWFGLRWQGMLGASIGCALGTVVGALAAALPMGTAFLLRTTRSWRIPLGTTVLLWPLCWILSRGFWPREFCAALVFSVVVAWLWWRKDDGGLASIFERLKNLGPSFGPSLSRLP